MKIVLFHLHNGTGLPMGRCQPDCFVRNTKSRIPDRFQGVPQLTQGLYLEDWELN